jgi:hypothetical protein
MSTCEGVESICKNKQVRERIPKSIGPVPENFGDQVALGHIIARKIRNQGFRGQTAALAMVDRATSFKWGKAQLQKTGAANLEALQQFQGPDAKDQIKYVWSDATPEIIYAANKLGVRGNHDTSAPGDSQGNGIAENNNRDIKMCAASLLSHAGIPLAYWPLAMPFRTKCSNCGRHVSIL